jgi:hypothetical protein
VKTYWTKGQETLDIRPLLSAFQTLFPRFRLREQHDVQEALLCIIDILEREVPEMKQWFYGKKVQETIWPGGKSSNEEDFCIHLIPSDGKDMGEMLKKSTDWNVLTDFEDTEGKVHNVATTRMVLSKLPQVFMISFDRKSHIKIIETIKGYTLVASAVHVGNQNDGHYVSFVKRRNKWFLLNDDSTEECELPEEAGHYVMIYTTSSSSYYSYSSRT